MIEITSDGNSQFRRFFTLLSSRGIKKEGLFLLSGENLIREFLEQQDLLSHLQVEAEITFDSTQSYGDRLPRSAKSYLMSRALFNQLDWIGTHHPLLVLKVPEIKEWTPTELKGLTVLTPLGDPGNLGSLMRSCDAFGIKNLVLLQEAAHPFLPKTVKASAGSALRLQLHHGPSVDTLKDFDFVLKNLVALDIHGETLANFQWPKDSFLLLGEEGRGLPLGLKAAHRLKIPTTNVESLNAVVAASVALYDFSLKQ
jgi:TrmH family RNA methyltransferase